MPVKITKDGRTILCGRHYAQFRSDLHSLNDGRCSKCGKATSLTLPTEFSASFHVHHTNGRGMGGSKRDDTIKSCQGLCGTCHRSEHNQ